MTPTGALKEPTSISRLKAIPALLEQHIESQVENEDSNLGDLLADPKAQQPRDLAMKGEIIKILLDTLAEIDCREADVVIRRFGLNLPRPQTLDEIAPTLNVSKERVRQIQNDGLKALFRLLEIKLRDFPDALENFGLLLPDEVRYDRT